MNKLHCALGIILAVLCLSTPAINAVSGQTSGSTGGSAPATAWLQEYGNSDTESVSNVVQTSDGGYAFLDQGWGHQFTFVPATFYKVNSSGAVQWKKSLGSFWGGSLVQTRMEDTRF